MKNTLNSLDGHLLARVRARVRHAAAACAVAWPAALLAQAAAPPATPPDGGLDRATLQQIQHLSQHAGAGLAPGAVRVEIEPGRLDPRLRLAPCERIEAFLPPGARAWGRTRVGLRCAQGPTPWSVQLPVTVKVFAPAWVAAAALPSGTVLQAEQLREAEVDWAAETSPAVADVSRLVGRALARPLAAGSAVRASDLKQRQWFGAGDTVQLVARGSGFSVTGEGQAMSAGIEGQTVRVRTEGGRVLSGQVVGSNRVEVQL
ncbi:MAG: flagellar basal body P-ring formation chaperone FlgA [Rubrivivax sp.]